MGKKNVHKKVLTGFNPKITIGPGEAYFDGYCVYELRTNTLGTLTPSGKVVVYFTDDGDMGVRWLEDIPHGAKHTTLMTVKKWFHKK